MDNDILLVQEEPRGPSILIEIPVTQNTARQKIQLPDVQELRSTTTTIIIVKCIRLITIKVLARGVLVNQPNAPLTELANWTLTLFSDSWLKGQNIPLLVLNDMADADATAATTIPYRNKATRLNNWRNVDWPQSFLQGVSGFNPTPPYAILLEVEYVKLNAQGQEINPVTQ